MATQYAVFTPDYGAATGAGMTGTITAGTPTGVITIGKNRLFRIFAAAATTTGALGIVIRFTLGNSTTTAAPSPTSSSPFFVTNQELLFEFTGEYDQINLNVLAADNPATSTAIVYSIVPVVRA